MKYCETPLERSKLHPPGLLHLIKQHRGFVIDSSVCVNSFNRTEAPSWLEILEDVDFSELRKPSWPFVWFTADWLVFSFSLCNPDLFIVPVDSDSHLAHFHRLVSPVTDPHR